MCSVVFIIGTLHKTIKRKFGMERCINYFFWKHQLSCVFPSNFWFFPAFTIKISNFFCYFYQNIGFLSLILSKYQLSFYRPSFVSSIKTLTFLFYFYQNIDFLSLILSKYRLSFYRPSFIISIKISTFFCYFLMSQKTETQL